MVKSNLVTTFGRALFIAVFAGSAFEKITNFDKVTGGPLTSLMAPKLDAFISKVHELTGFDIPIPKSSYPQILLTAAVCEAFGAILFGMDIAFGAVVLIIFIIPTSVIMHNFWEAPTPQVRFINKASSNL
ncbi:hypothetical protein CEUSTIGMA_g10384.t1 [Chlamydomonas eustigma]|uniref:DoxX family protein n=1 Tax=Chlamydomonas eustigma TaxID=1157962 RepID=A0A250XIQ2_9CHLO|nr:hypothetical protein CEUSTIGMA_g10384.t1 [Chlamydomonas eustigma]|eukprot:GAX82957.1 hypothetical protein CEUSTIGMA_g10384.t1 [Chlamydomonas eustigma]